MRGLIRPAVPMILLGPVEIGDMHKNNGRCLGRGRVDEFSRG